MVTRKAKPASKAALVKKPVATKVKKAAPKAVAKPGSAPKFANNVVLNSAAKSATKAKSSPAKVAKPIKVKLIRDSFTMPAYDYALINTLKARALDNKAVLKKSELLRAGLHALSRLEAQQLIALVGTLEVVKAGRPKH